MKPTDQALLQQFIRTRSGTAFDQLVQRHAGIVHSSILRQVRNPALAEDATQAVFLVLAQKAPTLADRPALGGWLLKTARYAAVDALRKESRHARHEKKASQQRPEATPATTPADEAQLTALDDALASLASPDREALLLRYFQDESFADIAIALGTTEEAARKRTTRALDKLRRLLHRRGTPSLTLAALAALLAGSAKTATAASAKLAVTSPLNILAATSRGASISKGVTHMFVAAKLKLLAAVSLTSVTCVTAGLVMYVAVQSGKAPRVPAYSAAVPVAIDTPATPADAPTFVGNTVQSDAGTLIITDADGTSRQIPVTQLEGTLPPPAAAAGSGTVKTIVFLLNNAPDATPVGPTNAYESSVSGLDQNTIAGVSSLNLIAKGVILSNPAVSIPDGGQLTIGGQKSDRTVVFTANTYTQQDKATGEAGTTMTVLTDGKTPASLTVKSENGQTTTLSLPNGSTITTKKSADLP